MKKNHAEQRGNARVKLPQRNQVEMHWHSLDQMIREDHLARTVAAYVESLDLSDFYRDIKAVEGQKGRNPIDPRILFSLWLFATLEGENSARRIAKLCERDFAYMWICGGVSVNHHTLSDFRTCHAQRLEEILTDSVALLQHHGLIELRTIAQDGMRVRASAGSGSFRKQASLTESRSAAETYLDQLRSDQGQEDESGNDEDEGSKPSAGQAAARLRAANERLVRLEEACQEMDKMQQRYAERNKNKNREQHRSEPRASTTDPEARRMKMGDGGFRPAMNVQFASDVDTQVIIGVEVTNEGSDSALLQPMYDSVSEQYGLTPESYLADGGFSKKSSVTYIERQGTKFYGPLPNERKQLDAGQDPYASKKGENAHYTAYRQRMGTEEGKAMRSRRAAAAEFPNAVCRNQGLNQFSVRGMFKTKAQTLWHALAFNFRRFRNLIDSETKRSYLEVLMAS